MSYQLFSVNTFYYKKRDLLIFHNKKETNFVFISYILAYVKNRYVEVPHSQLTRAATDKCVQTRRNFRKKIKAAQSYFGMFPSM